MKEKKGIRADLILIAGLLLIGGIIAAIVLLTGNKGDTVAVRVDGNVVREFALSEDVEYEIAGADGGRNLLVIRDGSAWIEEADCPDGLCRKMGRISMAGQSIVCLPHKVVVEIVSSAEEAEEIVDVYVK